MNIESKKIRIINAYGPQEQGENYNDKVLHFWNDLEREIIKARDDGCLIMVQTDSNAKLGKEYISRDPNEMSNNGKLMIGMVDRQELVVANTLEKCIGTITRHRVVDGKLDNLFLIISFYVKGLETC